jgi:hypothetical protein
MTLLLCPQSDVWAAHVDQTCITLRMAGTKDAIRPASTHLYLEANPHVAAAGINPLLHYDQFGWRGDVTPDRTSTLILLVGQLRRHGGSYRSLAHYLQYGQKRPRGIHDAGSIRRQLQRRPRQRPMAMIS